MATAKGSKAPSTPDYIQAAISQGISNFNAITMLAVLLARAGIMKPEDATFLHSMMSKPYDLEGVATNPVIAMHQERVDGILSEIQAAIAKRDK